jgi:DNA-binding NarL/FixJ family response regulator
MSISARILVADDHEVVRDGIRLLLARQGLHQVVAEAADGLTAIEDASRLNPDLAIVDLHMPRLGGLELIRRLSERAPNTKVIVLSVDGDEHVVREAIQAGVQGYVLKSNTSADVLRAVDVVLSGHSYFSQDVTTTIADLYRKEAARRPNTLSRRETEVLRLLADGKSSKQIADTLGVSVTTIDSHRHSIMKRLGLFSIAELTKYAIRERLTKLHG